MTKPESVILKEVQLEASKHGVVLWRNHTAGIEDKNGRWHRMGLCKGSSDLVGFVKDGTCRFVAIEVKKPGGRLSPEQSAFIDFINKNGGIAFVIDDKNNFEKELYSRL